MKCLSQGVVALAFVVSVGMCSTARSAGPAGPEVIDIDVDVADLPDTRAEIADTVAAELQRLLSEQDELPPGVIVGEDRRLLVVLRPGPIPGADDVLIRIEAQLDGKTLSESVTETCLSCSNEQVAEKALPMLRPLLDGFPAPERVAEPAKLAEPTGAEVDVADTSTRARPKQALLISGAALLGVGVAGLGAGVALIVANERVVSEPGVGELDVIKYRDAGIGVAVVGGVAAVTGAVLVALAFRGRERSGVSAGPVLTPSTYGVALSGRF